jgi:hypothetical protein
MVADRGLWQASVSRQWCTQESVITIPVGRPTARPASPPLAVPAAHRIFRLRLRLPRRRYLRQPFRAISPACWLGRRSKRGEAHRASAELRDVFARSQAMLKRRLRNPRREQSKIQIAFPCSPSVVARPRSPGAHLQGRRPQAVKTRSKRGRDRSSGLAAGTLCRNSRFSDLFPGDVEIFLLAQQDPAPIDQRPYFSDKARDCEHGQALRPPGRASSGGHRRRKRGVRNGRRNAIIFRAVVGSNTADTMARGIVWPIGIIYSLREEQ